MSELTEAMVQDFGFEAVSYPFSADFSLPGQWLEPLEMEAGKTYPLWIYLHGAGQRGSDGWRQLELGAADFFAQNDFREHEPFFLLAPQCPVDHRWVEVHWGLEDHIQPESPSRQMEALMEWIEELKSTHPIDPSRIYVTGVSMGGAGTWDLLMRLPDQFAAAAVICGAADSSKAELVKDIPLRLYHGSEDTVVLTMRSQVMYRLLTDLKADVTYIEYDGVKHDSWNQAFADPDLKTWLFAQKAV